MKIDDAHLVESTAKAVGVGAKLHAVFFEHIARTADARRCIVAVFCHFVARSGNDKACACRYVERVFAVSAGADDVDRLERRQVDATASFEQSFAEPEKFVDGHTAHLQRCQKCSNLHVGIALLYYVQHYLPCLRLREFFA